MNVKTDLAALAGVVVTMALSVGCGVLAPDACSRGEPVVDALERKTLKHCTDITATDLAEIESLNIGFSAKLLC